VYTHESWVSAGHTAQKYKDRIFKTREASLCQDAATGLVACRPPAPFRVHTYLMLNSCFRAQRSLVMPTTK
jgi:hypothetical protein